MFSKKIKKVIMVDGMHCNNCVKKVTDELIILGTSKVKVNLDKKEVTIYSKEEIDSDLIEIAINNLEFKYLGEVK